MYGLPDDFDGSWFVGKVLNIVLFTENSIYMGFDNDVSLTMEYAFEHRLDGGDQPGEMLQIPVTHSSMLMQLVGHRVESARAEEDGTLTLCFSNKHVFRCFDRLGYEAYRIARGTEETFV